MTANRRRLHLGVLCLLIGSILAASCVRPAPAKPANPTPDLSAWIEPTPSPNPITPPVETSAQIAPAPTEGAAGEPTGLPSTAAPPESPAQQLFLPSISSAAIVTPSLPPVEAGLAVWIDPTLPEGLRQAVQLPPGFSAVEQRDQASLYIEVGEEPLLGRWVYALVAPFPTVTQGMSSVALRHAWNNQPLERPLLVDESTYAVFTAKWGPAAEGSVRLLPAENILGAAWDGASWAIIPFERLEPRWKVLEVDSQSPLRKSFDPAAYALSVPLALRGDTSLVEALGSLHGFGSPAPILPPSNRDPGKLSVLAMTGVTALVRATASTMERRGVTYPAQDVGPWLRDADITHISNEVPFAKDCPYPDPLQPGMRFCSDPRYIALLEEVGADVIELTGDHFADWGDAAMRYTLELYRERGWGYYGGGENYADGRKALLIEHNGNRIAFIGCNGKGGPFAQASEKRPGAVTCDFDFLQAEIARLRAEGYLPVATFQHFEYYTYKAQPDQVRDFRRLAGAGAVVVSGSQAHQPQALEFVDQALIHYGLGNLFFDQYDVSEATRQGFIDRHVFYDGRYLGAELLGIQFVDYARPRPMTAEEQGDLLRKVFKASGW